MGFNPKKLVSLLSKTTHRFALLLRGPNPTTSNRTKNSIEPYIAQSKVLFDPLFRRLLVEETRTIGPDIFLGESGKRILRVLFCVLQWDPFIHSLPFLGFVLGGRPAWNHASVSPNPPAHTPTQAFHLREWQPQSLPHWPISLVDYSAILKHCLLPQLATSDTTSPTPTATVGHASATSR